MARIRDYKFSQVNGTSFTPSAPDIQSGDGVILIVWNGDQTDTSWYTLTGWTQLGISTKVVTFFNYNVYYAVAPVSMPTISYSGTEKRKALVISFKGCPSSFIDSFSEASNSGLTTKKKVIAGSGSFAPTAANCTILTFELYNTKGSAYRPMYDPLDIPLTDYDEVTITGANEGGIAFSAWQHDPATTAIKTGNSRIATDNYRAMVTIAIKDDGNDTYRQPTIYSPGSKRISNFAYESVDDWTIDIPGDYIDCTTTYGAASIAGETPVYYAIKTKGTVFPSALGVLGYSQTKGSSFGEQLTANTLNGFTYQFTTAIDFTNKLLVIHFSADNLTRRPPLDPIGFLLGFEDSSGNFSVFQMPADACVPGVNTFVVHPGHTTTYATSGTLDITDIKGVTPFVDADSNVANEYICWSSFTVIGSDVITGGGSAAAVTASDAGTLVRGQIVNAQGVQGAKQLLLTRPITAGSQSAKSYIDWSQSAIEFAGTTRQKGSYILLSDNCIGLTLDTKSGSTFSAANSLLGGNTRFFIKATSSIAGTNDLSGLTVTNAGTVDLRSGMDLTGTAFVNPSSFNQYGLDFTGMGTSIDNCEATIVFTITTQAELNKLASILFTNCNTCIKVNVSSSVTTLNFPDLLFGSTNTWAVEYSNDHDITFTRSGTTDLTLDKVNETGAGTVTLNTGTVITVAAPELLDNTRCRLVNVTNSGTVTSITRSSTTATVTKTAHGLETGWTVTIVGADQPEYNGNYTITVTGANTFTYTVSGSPATPATGTIEAEHEIDNSVVSGGTGYSFTTTVDVGTEIQDGDSIVLLGTYYNTGTAKDVFRGSAVAGTSDITFPDAQTNWEYHNSAAADGSDVPECGTDYVNIEVEVDDDDNSTTKKRIAAFIVNALTTADGIRYWVALDGTPVINYISAGSALINFDVTTVRINNIKNANLRIVDSFKLRSSTGASLIQDTTYTIEFDNTDEVAVIETGTSGLTVEESAKLDSIPGDVWDIARSGHTASGTFGESFIPVINGLVDTGSFSATTTQFESDTITEATANHYRGRIITFVSGALQGQSTDITAYSLQGSNGRFTVTALTEAPANNDRFVIN